MATKIEAASNWQTSKIPNDFIENQYINDYLKQGASSHAALALCTLAMYAILLSNIDGYYPHIFLAIALLANSTRILLTHKILDKSVDKIASISKLHFLRGTTHALPILGFAYLGELDKSIITIILLTISTASVSTTNGYKRKYLWFVVPLLVPLSLAWALDASAATNKQLWGNYTLSFLIILYLFYLIGLGKNLFKVFSESCHIRFSEGEKNQKLILALESAKNASLAKTRFLATASHDLRQPMHTIGVLLAALGMRQLDDRSREILNVLGTVNVSLASQLDGLLDVSKLDAGVVKPEFLVCRLDELVRSHVAKMSLTVKNEDIYVHVHANKEVLVRTDAVLLDRVLMNLIGNAIKFTKKGGVDVTLSTTNGKVILEVADTGIGIEDSFQVLIFQEFYQVGNPERVRSAGLGLGLSIVQRICTLLDIHLHLISAPGQGSRFVLTMPIVKDGTYLPIKKELTQTSHLSPINVLVIDDEIDVRTGMRLLLEELGCSVVLANGIDQAIASTKTHKFDMVFSDYLLRDDENGIDAILHVRVIQPGVGAVLITGDTAPERMQSAHNAGIKMLHKPVLIDDIVKQLKMASANR